MPEIFSERLTIFFISFFELTPPEYKKVCFSLFDKNLISFKSIPEQRPSWSIELTKNSPSKYIPINSNQSSNVCFCKLREESAKHLNCPSKN